MGKIKAGVVPGKSSNIPKPPIQAAGVIRFSFKYLDLVSNQKFGIHQCAEGYLAKLLERLKDLSSLSEMEFRASRSSSLRAHQIDWERTSEPNGFLSLNEQLRALRAWQFEITSNAHGRVHGFLLEDTFFVVWVDPAHQLYPAR